MKWIRATCISSALAVLLLLPAEPRAQSNDEVILRQAIELEKVKGDKKGAEALYRRLLTSSDPKVSVAAREALRRLNPPPPAAQPRSQAPFPSELVAQPGSAEGITMRRRLPDGRQIGIRRLGSNQRLQGKLVLLDQGGAEHELMTLNGIPYLDNDVEVSPTGKHVAVIVGVRQGLPGQPQAYSEELVVTATQPGSAPPHVVTWWPVAPAAGSRPFDFTPMLQWSPDGMTLPFLQPLSASGKFDAQLLNAATGERRSLGIEVDGPPDFRWSPDGTQLALHVTDRSKGLDEIQIVSIPGGRIRSITVPAKPGATGARTRLAAWTTKAGLAIVTSPAHPLESDAWLLNVETGGARKICGGRGDALLVNRGTNDRALRGGTWDDCLELTKDGTRQIVWLRSSKRLALRDTATGVDTYFTRGSGEEYAAHLSPDETFVIFLSNRTGKWGLYAVMLDQLPATAPVLLSSLEGPPAGFGLTWLGESMTAGISYYETNLYKVVVDKTTGKAVGDPERLTQNSPANGSPSISPDGKQIAYFSNASQFGLSTMDADGANERQITNQPFIRWHGAPIWLSPTQVVIEVHHPEQALRFSSQVLELTTGRMQPQTMPKADFPEASDAAPSFVAVPGLNAVAYITKDANRVQTVRLRSWLDGADRLLGSFPGGGVHAFTASRDGGRVAFSRYTTADKCPCEIGVLDTADNQIRILETRPNAQTLVAFSPDARFLLYGRARPRIMDMNSGTSWFLIEAPQQTGGIPAWIEQGSWSPDGSYVVLTIPTNRTERRRFSNVSIETVRKAAAAGR